MRGCLRVDVAKREAVVVFIDDGRGNLAGDDLAEYRSHDVPSVCGGGVDSESLGLRGSRPGLRSAHVVGGPANELIGKRVDRLGQ